MVLLAGRLSNKRLLLTRVAFVGDGPLACRLAPLVGGKPVQQNRETLDSGIAKTFSLAKRYLLW